MGKKLREISIFLLQFFLYIVSALHFWDSYQIDFQNSSICFLYLFIVFSCTCLFGLFIAFWEKPVGRSSWLLNGFISFHSCLLGTFIEFVYFPRLLIYFFIAMFCFISAVFLLISSLMTIIQTLSFSVYYFFTVYFPFHCKFYLWWFSFSRAWWFLVILSCFFGCAAK